MSRCPCCNQLTPTEIIAANVICGTCAEKRDRNPYHYHPDKPGQLCGCQTCICLHYTEDDICDDCREGHHEN